MVRRLPVSVGIVVLLAPLALVRAATSFTPLEWQQVVRKHSTEALIGQRKNTTWIRDKNRNFIDDEIEARYHRGEVVDITVELNTCLRPYLPLYDQCGGSDTSLRTPNTVAPISCSSGFCPVRGRLSILVRSGAGRVIKSVSFQDRFMSMALP